MPKRNIVLATEQIYHIFNRTIDHKPVFKFKKELQRAVTALWYFRYEKRLHSLSAYLRLGKELQNNSFKQLLKSSRSVDILSYCLMSNHYHLLIKQIKDRGISKYLSDFQNSYTRYYNAIYNRRGQVFLNQFKAVHIEREEQLIHISRYIHLNPYSGFLVKNLDDLLNYSWSSLQEYVKTGSLRMPKYQFVNTQEVLSYFKGKKSYKKFVLDQADYQRELDRIKHLTFEI